MCGLAFFFICQINILMEYAGGVLTDICFNSVESATKSKLMIGEKNSFIAKFLVEV